MADQDLKLVPVVPTDAMCAAAGRACDGMNLSKMGVKARARHNADVRYRAMLAAAPAVDDWTPVGTKLPDDCITVMVSLSGEEEGEPVWLGFHEDNGWHSATDGAPLGNKVLGWKPIPEGMTGG